MRARGILSASVCITLFVLLFCLSSGAYACASCGSGGDDPLILYPNERLKIFSGVSNTNNFENIDPDGSASNAGGPKTKQTLTSAIGYGISPRAFATLSLPVVRNVLGPSSRHAIGDPSLAGRYSVFLQSIDEPLLPQVQLVYGYKHAQAKSLRDSNELKTLIDVFGSGFSEAKFGLDVWLGITKLKPGLSQQFSIPMKKKFAGVTFEPGLISKTTLSLGYNVFEHWKATLGVVRDLRAPLKVDGVAQKNSEQLNHSVFATSDYRITEAGTIRVAVSRLAALAENHNTIKSDTFNLAYMQNL